MNYQNMDMVNKDTTVNGTINMFNTMYQALLQSLMYP